MQATPEQIGRLTIFSDLEITSLLDLVSGSTWRSYAKGEVVMQEDQALSPHLHGLIAGTLLTSKFSSSGKETVFRMLLAGEMFASPVLFGNGLAPATVTAVEPAEVITIPREALLSSVREHPEVALRVFRHLTRRIQEMHQTIHGLISERALVRLCRLLQVTVSVSGVDATPGGDVIRTLMPYQRMAGMLGITYEECVRLMNGELKGIIRYRRGGMITILDHGALASLAGPPAALGPCNGSSGLGQEP